MSDSTDLERRYRRLLAFYPTAFRREHEQEILSVLMDGAAEGQQRPRLADSVNLLTYATSMRLRQLAPSHLLRRLRRKGGIPMDAPDEYTAFWRSGMNRLIPPWQRPHLRVFATLQLTTCVIPAVCGVLTLVFGGSGGKTYGFAALFLGLAALVAACGYWELTIARSAPSTA
jgi:hypothetical protein